MIETTKEMRYMYCSSCGVKLADTEEKCPLCGLEAYHPKIQREVLQKNYPVDLYPEKEVSPWGIKMLILVCFVLPLIVVLLCDLPVHGEITWSGYVIGALILAYTSVVLPYWFRNPNPVIFVPIGFAVACLYLWYINYATQGDWFMTLAFPVVGFFCIVVETVVTLLRYIRRGRLYIFGGAITATGLFLPVMELLIDITFGVKYYYWSFYPLGVLVLVGSFLIFLGICRPAREVMERKFFL